MSEKLFPPVEPVVFVPVRLLKEGENPISWVREVERPALALAQAALIEKQRRQNVIEERLLLAETVAKIDDSNALVSLRRMAAVLAQGHRVIWRSE